MDDLREVIAGAIAESDRNKESGVRMADLWGNESYRRTVTKHADAALAAIKQAGFVVVPAEPTEAMISAGLPIADLDSGHPEDIYRAMIEASNAPT